MKHTKIIKRKDDASKMQENQKGKNMFKNLRYDINNIYNQNL